MLSDRRHFHMCNQDGLITGVSSFKLRANAIKQPFVYDVACKMNEKFPMTAGKFLVRLIA
jgi:hypothetical protein